MGTAIIVVLLVLVAALLLVRTLGAFGRSDDHESVAAAAGLRYSDGDPFHTMQIDLDLFRKGLQRGARNLMWAQTDDGRALRVFRYWWVNTPTELSAEPIGVPRSERTCALAQVNGSWPALRLDRENVGIRLADRVGDLDIDFESEAFNRTFLVRCADRRFATTLLDARMIEFLLSTQGEVEFELRGRWLVAHTPAVRAELYPALLGVARRFLELVPPVVWDLYPSEFVGGDGAHLPPAEPVIFERATREEDWWTALDRSPFYPAEPRPPGAPDYDLDGNSLPDT